MINSLIIKYYCSTPKKAMVAKLAAEAIWAESIIKFIANN
jgi:hypothetical protein